MSLKAFLNPPKPKNEKVVISDRFTEDGEPVAFEIRAMSQKENSKLMDKCTERDKKTGVETLNRTKYSNTLVASAVVYPDLKNAELQKFYGVLGEVNVLIEMLTIGEFAKLSEAVSKLSGLDEDMNADIEEAKNA